MDIDNLRKIMKRILSDNRYRHSVAVEEVSFDLALIHGEDTLKASIAGILHDCSRCLADAELVDECERNQINISEIERKLPQKLLHAKLGAVYARVKYGVIDDNILKAIEFHTTGRPAMSKLEKIVYVADYIEPNRELIPNIDIIRKTAYQDLDEAIGIITKQTLDYLANKQNLIDPLTKETYDYYVNKRSD